jgi:hypothetical protein
MRYRNLGLALRSEAAVALAVDVRPSRPADSETRALSVVGDGDETISPPRPLIRPDDYRNSSRALVL